MQKPEKMNDNSKIQTHQCLSLICHGGLGNTVCGYDNKHHSLDTILCTLSRMSLSNYIYETIEVNSNEQSSLDVHL
jgi:hypothetical protein